MFFVVVGCVENDVVVSSRKKRERKRTKRQQEKEQINIAAVISQVPSRASLLVISSLSRLI